jgi:hypothetical protein
MKISSFIILFLIVCSCKKDKVEFYSTSNCSDTVSFNTEILPIIIENCSACHDNGQNGYSFTNHANISANSSAIIGSMRNSGFLLMPRDGNNISYALPDSIIQRVECWIDQGKKNN